MRFLLVFAALAASVAAGPSWANSSQTPTCGKSETDPICEVWTPEEVARIPWHRYQSWPVMLVPAWRYDGFLKLALDLKDCKLRLEEEKQLCDSWLDEVEKAHKLECLRLSVALEKCEETLDQCGQGWAWWEVTLLGVGVGVGAAALGFVVGHFVAW